MDDRLFTSGLFKASDRQKEKDRLLGAYRYFEKLLHNTDESDANYSDIRKLAKYGMKSALDEYKSKVKA